MTSNAGQESLDKYLKLLKKGGSLSLVALQEDGIHFSPGLLVPFARSISSSIIGGRKEMVEMLNFSAKHSIIPLVESFPIERVNEAIGRVRSGAVRYRAVLNIKQ